MKLEHDAVFKEKNPILEKILADLRKSSRSNRVTKVEQQLTSMWGVFTPSKRILSS